MHALKFFVLPSLAVAVWMSLAAGTLLGFGEFAMATNPPAKVKKAPVQSIEAPVLTAKR
ncbi:MAG: hypothetical protein IT380_22940 [Myxococcales bacterium]|nr:hypothetical protein [Myxococcales bacterium]